MNSIIRNLSSQLLRNSNRQLIRLPYAAFATDAKEIEKMTTKSKVVVFMKVRRMKNLSIFY